MAVVASGRLTDDLVPRRGKQYGPEGWGSYPVVRERQVRAAWTEQGARPVQKMSLPPHDEESAAEVRRVMQLTADQAAADLARRGTVRPKLRALSDDELEAIFHQEKLA